MGEDPVFRVKLMKLYPAPQDKKDTNTYIQDAHNEIKRQVESWHREGR
jgi:hypothetical protein